MKSHFHLLRRDVSCRLLGTLVFLSLFVPNVKFFPVFVLLNEKNELGGLNRREYAPDLVDLAF